jgi:hypothetical protein
MFNTPPLSLTSWNERFARADGHQKGKMLVIAIPEVFFKDKAYPQRHDEKSLEYRETPSSLN